MKNSSVSKFCLAPWFHSFIHADGSIRPCCVSRDKIGDTQNDDSIMSVWNSPKYVNLREKFLNNEPIPGCKSCFSKEDSGATSRRQYLNNVIQDLTGKHIDLLKQDLSSWAKVQFVTLDISLGNQCNLRCRFCGPYNSTKWIGTAEKLFKKNSAFWKNIFELKTYNPIQQKFEPLQELLKSSEHLQQIEFKGGEPFIMENHFYFLNMLIETNRAKNIELVYVTNGTFIQEKTLELFRFFKSISLTVSIDGTSELYKYLRGENFSVENEILNNLKMFDQIDNISLNIHFTLSAYNIFGVKDFVNWFNSLQLKKLKNWSWGLVAFPNEISLNSLPSEFLKKAAHNLNEVSGQNVKDIQNVLLRKSIENAGLVNPQSFITYVSDLDEARGTCFIDIAPEFQDLFIKPSGN